MDDDWCLRLPSAVSGIIHFRLLFPPPEQNLGLAPPKHGVEMELDPSAQSCSGQSIDDHVARILFLLKSLELWSGR